MTTAEGYIQEVLRNMPTATPQRSQIALELRGHIAERVAAGMLRRTSWMYPSAVVIGASSFSQQFAHHAGEAHPFPA